MRDEIRRWNGVPWYPVRHPVRLVSLEDHDWQAMEVADEAPPFVLSTDLRLRLDDALSTLSRREREAVELAFFEDLPVKDVAERMGISVSGAYVYRWAAVQKLRSFFSAPQVDP